MTAVTEKSLRSRRKCDSRVRSGCQTCKKYHVKCDETKPNCLKCSDGRRRCTYADPFRSVCATIPQASTSNVLPKTIDLGFGLPSDALSRSCFYYFRRKTSHVISSLLSDDFWTSYVLPMSASCESVQHAIVALATQHRTWTENRKLGGRISQIGSMHSSQNYGKAIRSLNRQIEDQSKTGLVVEETLTTCLLLICFNILHGNDVDALMHLEAGLQIYKMCHTRLRKPYLRELALSFKRLDLQAAWYIGTYHISSLAANDSDTVVLQQLNLDEPSSAFSSVADAREALDNLICSTLSFIRTKAAPAKYLKSQDEGYQNPNNSRLSYQRDEFMNQLQGWEWLFKKLEAQSLYSHSYTERTNISKHWICYNVILISLSVCLSPHESTYDQYQAKFLDIIQHAEQVFQSATLSDRGESTQQLFSLDMSIIQPLYFMTLKCRDVKLRHRSLELLRRCGKEGVWDGDIMAIVAQHVVSLEESKRYFDPLAQRVQIFEADRISGTAINLMRAERKIWVQCSTRKWNTSEIEMGKAVQGSEQEYTWDFHETILDI